MSRFRVHLANGDTQEVTAVTANGARAQVKDIYEGEYQGAHALSRCPRIDKVEKIR